MGSIVLKIPRGRQKVRILRSEEAIRQEIERRTYLEAGLLREAEPEPLPEEAEIPIVEDLEPEAEPVQAPAAPGKSVYTEIYTISDSNQPLEIDLTNVHDHEQVIGSIQEEVQSAYDRGFNDGQEAAKAAMNSEMDNYATWINKFETLSAELNSEHLDETRNLTNQLVPLAVMIAEQILRHEISTNGELLVEQIQNALEALDDEAVYKIFINPADMEILQKAKSRLTHDPARLEKTLISPNPAVDRGTCVLSTSSGTIDARLRTQIERSRRVLEAAASRGPGAAG